MAGWVLRPLKSAASPSSEECISSLKTQNWNSACSLLRWRFSVELPSQYDDRLHGDRFFWLSGYSY